MPDLIGGDGSGAGGSSLAKIALSGSSRGAKDSPRNRTPAAGVGRARQLLRPKGQGAAWRRYGVAEPGREGRGSRCFNRPIEFRAVASTA